MKTRLFNRFAVITLAIAGAFSMGAMAQTTDEGPGPSEQPSQPMEIGQPQDQTQGPQPSDTQPSDAQPEAQPGGPSGEAPATTDQGVGRVSLIHGDVSTQRGDSGDWSAATLNQPLMGGDKVSTGDGARTELQLDYANIFRLGANSKANIVTFTHKDIQIQLAQGLASYTVSKNSQAEPEIDTPNVTVHPAHQDGVFRVEVRPDGDTIVIVRKGEAQIATPEGSAEVRAGEMATVRGDSNSAQYKISNAPDRDDWDRWISDRDHMIENAQSWHHTNRYYTGAQDLDAYGQWRNVPDYGDVWVPNESSDWVPYRDGNWTYEPYYGWTWVGYEPWGWAPYHYGRWFWWNNAWAWWPGPAWGWYQPFWAPAYVSFWGWGGGFGFGWLPLGPCDWFHPWWGGYGGRFGWVGRGWYGGRWGGISPLHGGTRFSNVVNIREAHIGRALSTSGAGFGAHAHPVAASHEQIGRARMMAGNLPVVPTRASLSASGRAAAGSTVRNGGSERFFGSVHANASRPASFERQTASLRQSMAQNHVNGFSAGGGRTSGESMARQSAGNTNAMKPSAGASQGPRQMNNSGFGRSAGNSPASAQGENRGGFRGFTPPNSANTRPSSNAGASGYGNRGLGNESTRGSSPSSNRPTSRDGFRPFTPPSSSGGAPRGESMARGSSGSYWNRTAPNGSASRNESGSARSSSQGLGRGPYSRESSPYGSSSRGESSRGSYSRGESSRGSSSRPQLDMRQPIARPPSYGGSRSGNGGYRGSPSYGSPSYGGSHGAPNYGGHSSAPSYGGHGSAPSGGHSSGGGHSFGGGYSGGGGHSGGGGGHSSSGGGGHSSGGGGGHHR